MGDYTSKADEDFFAAIGRLTISWGQIELGLTITIHLIHNFLGNKRFENEVPSALNRKLTYLRAALKRLPVPETHRPKYDQFFDAIKAELVLRHDIVHGCVVEHAEGTGQAKLIRLIHKKTYWDQREVSVDTSTILKAAVRTSKLADKALTLAALLGDLLEDLANDTTRQRGEQEG